jgi:hypothetical protein
MHLKSDHMSEIRSPISRQKEMHKQWKTQCPTKIDEKICDKVSELVFTYRVNLESAINSYDEWMETKREHKLAVFIQRLEDAIHYKRSLEKLIAQYVPMFYNPKAWINKITNRKMYDVFIAAVKIIREGEPTESELVNGVKLALQTVDEEERLEYLVERKYPKYQPLRVAFA